MKQLAASALPGLLIAAFASPAMAQTAPAGATIEEVVNNFLANFRVTINGQALSPLSAGQIASGLAANVQITTKENGLPIVTLRNDVNVDIRSSNNPLSAPIAQLSFEADTFRFDPDPAVSYGLSVRNLSNSAQSYTFAWPLLFSPTLSGQTIVKSSFTGTLTDLGGAAGASITPTIGTKIQSSIVGPSPLASIVDVGDAYSFNTANASQNFAFYNPGPAPGANYALGPLASNLTFMNVTTAFSLSGRDRVSFTGFSEILPIPEPSTYALMLVGLGLAGVVARRTNASKR